MTGKANTKKSDTAEEAAVATDSEPINYHVDMQNVFAQTEALQKELNAQALKSVETSTKQFTASCAPAIEFAIAVLAEAAQLKVSMEPVKS